MYLVKLFKSTNIDLGRISFSCNNKIISVLYNFRTKRNVDLTPEEIVELLNLYEKNQRALQKLEAYDNVDENDDEAWY